MSMLVQLTAACGPGRGEAVWVEATEVVSVARGGGDRSDATLVMLANGQAFWVSESPGVAGEKLRAAETEKGE